MNELSPIRVRSGSGAQDKTGLFYLTGFGNEHASEALPGALPEGRNSPQRPPYGLYAEQLSGSPFTAPRTTNARTWFYRIRPSVCHGVKFKEIDRGLLRAAPCRETGDIVNQARWDAIPIEDGDATFVSGLRTIATAGDCHTQVGMAAHMYFANRPMADEYFYNADGEFLIVPQQGAMRFVTECGILDVAPGEICVIPRGIKFRAELIEGPARGYVCENYGAKLTIPERGPIGANALANPRDFMYPTAYYEDVERPGRMFLKYDGRLFACDLQQSPIDVVAWHGNFAPYKYALKNFCPIGATLYDHPDPSINTVLTSVSDTPGTANLDFVIFPDRWLVQEDTFRPPWYHMNIMTEFMGLVYGIYEAKPTGFVPGGMSLHNRMLPHGPSGEAHERASNAELKPVRLAGTMAFMFESRFPLIQTKYAAEHPGRDPLYPDDWGTLKKNFDPTRP